VIHFPAQHGSGFRLGYWRDFHHTANEAAGCDADDHLRGAGI
jgi:hypothetical protein